MTFHLLQKRAWSDQRGLTLLELLVVLSILAVLSTVALTSSSGLADQARYEATQRTLENIREAVLGPANLRDTDGTLLYTGFVADTGRLPRAVAEVVAGGTVLTLAELFEQPAGMAAYQVLPATTSNCTPSTEADAADPVPPAGVSADTVRLGVGWRGPYLRLTPGNLLPRDGWGAQLVTPVGVVPGFPNNCLLNGILPVAAGDPIDQIVSYGRDGALGGADAYDADLNVDLQNQSVSTLVVQVEIRNPGGTLLDHTLVPPTIERIFVRLFEPNSATGSISVQPARAPLGGPDPYDTYHSHSGPTLTFDPITTSPGPRALRAYALENAVPPKPDQADHKSPPYYLSVRPGSNTVKLILTVP